MLEVHVLSVGPTLAHIMVIYRIMCLGDRQITILWLKLYTY